MLRMRTMRSRLFLGFGGTMLTLLVTGIMAVWALDRVRRDVRDGVTASTDIAMTIARSQEAMLQHVATTQSALLSTAIHEGDESAMSDVADSLRRSVLQGDVLLTRDRQTLERIGGLQGRLEVRLAVARAYADVGLLEDAARQAQLSGELLDSLLAETSALSRGQETLRARALGQIDDLVASRRAMLALLLAVGCVTAGTFGFRTWRACTLPLGRLSAVATSLGDGDLRVDVSRDGLDAEYRVLAHAFDTMASRLRGIVRNLQGEVEEIGGAALALTAASDQTASSTNQISSAMADVANGAAEQRSSISESEQALERVAGSAAALSAAASACEAIARDIRATSEQARGQISGAVGTLERARAVIDQSRDSIKRVEGASGAVDAFVETVRRIAEQTNLLALNASIEAARAGEHGRGFGVVAGEIRRLAAQSNEAASDVSSVVAAMREEVRGAVKSVNEGAEELGDVGSVSGDAVTGLDRISEVVSGIDQIARSVAEAAGGHEQAIATLASRLRAAIEQADAQASASEEAAAAAQETAATAEEVSATAHRLASNAERLGALAAGLQV
jgi:methyl-accepting chemotaxis protein